MAKKIPPGGIFFTTPPGGLIWKWEFPNRLFRRGKWAVWQVSRRNGGKKICMLLNIPFLPRDEPFQTTGAPIFLFLRKVQRYFPSPIFLFLKVKGTKVPSVFSYSKGAPVTRLD